MSTFVRSIIRELYFLDWPDDEWEFLVLGLPGLRWLADKLLEPNWFASHSSSGIPMMIALSDKFKESVRLAASFGAVVGLMSIDLPKQRLTNEFIDEKLVIMFGGVRSPASELFDDIELDESSSSKDLLRLFGWLTFI